MTAEERILRNLMNDQYDLLITSTNFDAWVRFFQQQAWGHISVWDKELFNVQLEEIVNEK